MRDIKFRMWDEGNFKLTTPMLLEDLILKASTRNPNTFKWDCDIPIMQYTGLKDKNGKDIFEGDILCWWSDVDIVDGKLVEKRDYHIDSIKFLNGAFVVSDDDDIVLGHWIHEPTSDVEVIGNIYEDSELIDKID